MENRRVAICFSGLLKNYWQTIPNFLEMWVKANPTWNFYIFMDIWDKLDVRFENKYPYTQITTKDSNQLKTILNSDNIKHLEIVIEPYRLIDPTQYQKYLQDGDTHYDSKHPGEHILSMFYKINKCNNLKKDYENKSKSIFDLVVRIRTDLIFTSPIDLNSLSPDCFWIPGSIEEVFSDHCAISSSENIDYLAGLWNDIEEIITNHNVFNPHKLLRAHLGSKNCKVLPINNYALRVWGDLVRFYH